MKNIHLSLSLCIFIARIGLDGINGQKNVNGKCTLSNCPTMVGVCVSNECVCKEHYMTVAKMSNDGTYCNYAMKSRFIAFLLEFFFPFGIGHLYAENLTLAMIKFSLFMIFFIAFCCEFCFLQAKIGNCLVVTSFVFVIDLILWFFLQMIDIVGYSMRYYTDGNGLALY